jgi:hypothetical protein
MKLNNNFLISIAYLTISPGLVLAASPLTYDGWTTNASGTINTSASCASKPGVTCRTLVADKGFIQEEVKTPDYTYVRMIITDPIGAGGPAGKEFAAETFIPFAIGNAGVSQGIAGKQVVRDVANGFTDQAEIQTAMMRFSNPAMKTPFDPLPPTLAEDMFTVKLTQTFDKPDYQSTFKYTNYTAFNQDSNVNLIDTSTVIGHTMELTQDIPIPNTPNANASQLFVHKQAGGYKGNSIGIPYPNANYFISAPITTAGSAALNGKTINWAQGETIASTWVAENTGGMATVAQTLSNTTTGSANKADASLTMTGVQTPTSPAVWPAIFGAAPVFPTP